jgi:hypothetical protein
VPKFATASPHDHETARQPGLVALPDTLDVRATFAPWSERAGLRAGRVAI